MNASLFNRKDLFLKKLAVITLVISSLVASSAVAQVAVRGHTRSDGTYVQGHYRSNPNNTTTDNWSVRPNVNPYTGQRGTRPATDNNYSNSPTYRAPSYQAPRSSNRSTSTRNSSSYRPYY